MHSPLKPRETFLLCGVSVFLLLSLGPSLASGYRGARRFAPKQKCPADAQEEWSYQGFNGPENWGSIFPECAGKRQSPIDIKVREVKQNPYLKKLYFKNYNKPVKQARIRNTGRTVEITPEDDVRRSIDVNDDTYFLQQLHFHWGYEKNKGSEHALNGKRYAMELHLVHRNRNNEVAVVGVLMAENSYNKALKAIVDALPNVQYRDNSAKLGQGLKLDDLLPSNPASFYRYDGSLTTPMCDEGVIWTVLKEKISIAKDQITKFRQLNSADAKKVNANCKLVKNFRPVQFLNGRKIYSSN